MNDDFLDLYKGLDIYLDNRTKHLQGELYTATREDDWAYVLELKYGLQELDNVREELNAIASTRGSSFQGETADSAEEQLSFMFQED